VGGENATKRREDSGFPVDQRSVTVEGENFEAGEVEHGADPVLRDYELRSLPEQGLEVTAREAIELLALQFEHLSEFESDVGLGRQDNLLVSGESGATRARSRAGGRADGGSFAASGERSDNSTECGTAASKHRGALPLALLREAAGSSLNGQVRAVEVDRVQSNIQK